MSEFDEGQLPEELREVAGRLRAERATATPAELDRIKQRAAAGSRSSGSRRLGLGKGLPVRSRVLVAALTLLVIGGTTAGGIAGGGGGERGDDAAESQYRGCHQQSDSKSKSDDKKKGKDSCEQGGDKGGNGGDKGGNGGDKGGNGGDKGGKGH
jgi:hypothetical protein